MKISSFRLAHVASAFVIVCTNASLSLIESSHATEPPGTSEAAAVDKSRATQKPGPGIGPVEQGLQMEVSLAKPSQYYTNTPNVGTASNPVWLKMKITNLDHAPLEIADPFLDWQYYYPKDWPYTVKILDAHGQPVPETAYARDLERQSHHPGIRTVVTDTATLPVSKGKAFVVAFPAGMYYDLTLPGKYTVLVTYNVSLGNRKEDGTITLTASPLTIELRTAFLRERDSGVLDKEQDSNVLQGDEILNEYARKILLEKAPDEKRLTPK